MKKLDIFNRYTTPSQWKERALNMGNMENRNEVKVKGSGFKFAVAFAAAAVVIGTAAFYGISRNNNKIPQTANSGVSSSVSDSSTEKPVSDSKISVSGENLLGMTVEDALEFGENKYEMTYPTFVQAGTKSMYKCSDFVEYTFCGENNKYSEKSSGKISFVNLYEGAYINDRIKIGMTYNELKKLNGGKLDIYISNSDVAYCAYMEIDGHKWSISFDLTKQQQETIRKKIAEKAGGEEALTSDFSVMLGTGVDISDINPKSISAGYDTDWYKNNDNSDNSDNSDSTITKINGEILMDHTVQQVLDFGNNKYEMTYPTFVQQGDKDMYKCSEFPEYCFKSQDSKDARITDVNLYKGAYINDTIKVGMTYNELKELNGGELLIFNSNNDVKYSAKMEINGRDWFIAFDLTDEQEQEIRQKIIKAAGGEEKYTENPYNVGVDISDINPQSRAAGCCNI